MIRLTEGGEARSLGGGVAHVSLGQLPFESDGWSHAYCYDGLA